MTGETVLLADDDRLSREFLQEALTTFGCDGDPGCQRQGSVGGAARPVV